MEQNNTKEISPKSRATAAILAFVLGVFGAHRFYVGKVGTGVVMVLLAFTIVLSWVSAIWALIDFIVILVGNGTDKEGRALLNWSD